MYREEAIGFFYEIVFRHHEFPVWLFEAGFWVVVCVLTLALVKLRPIWMLRTESALARWSNHRGRCVFGIFFGVLAVRVLLLPLVGVPIPVVHDEFSYLLGADTFASCRLTNPPHPLWIYFESFHINVLPTYQSMYPPAQAAALALGKVVAGVPWVGVLVSTAALCAVLCWMLQQWLPPQWALVGGIFAAIRFGLISYWMNSYWGGSVAALGGALTVGALARLRRDPKRLDALVFGAGLLLMSLSRPMEGLLFSLPLSIAALWAISTGMGWKKASVQVVAPVLCILLLVGSWFLYFNWRSTGSVKTMPYAVNHATYHFSNPFLWQKSQAIPHYRHASMRIFYLYHEMPDYLNSRTRDGMAKLIASRALTYYWFFAWPAALLLVIAVRFALYDRELRMLVASLGLVLTALVVQVWPPQPHYAAPITGVVLLLFLNMLRILHRNQRFTWMPWLSRSIAIAIMALMCNAFVYVALTPYGYKAEWDMLWKAVDRQRLQTELEHTPGKHLVIVHYPLRDRPSVDWIYNEADINKAKVVWARDMDGANEPLLKYFSDREVWYVDRGDGLSKLYRYQTTEQQRNELAHLVTAGSIR